MMNALLSQWQFASENAQYTAVLPDGCRDLIFKQNGVGRPLWFVSSLDDGVSNVPILKGDHYVGFRLMPGCRVDEAPLLKAVNGLEPDDGRVLDLIDRFAAVDERTDEILTCLGKGSDSVSETAGLFGVSTRTLQRTVIEATGRTPVFWAQLARVRRAGRLVAGGETLAGVAAQCGFSDQAHMTRQFKRWFSISPNDWRAGDDGGGFQLSSGYF